MIKMERNYNCIRKTIKNDERTIDILTNLSSLRTRGIKKMLKSAALICAFYIFALSIYSFLFNMSFTWIFMLLSIGFVAIGLGLEKIQKILIKATLNKEKLKENVEIEYFFSKEGIDIGTGIGATHNDWNSFVCKGEIENHIYVIRNDNKAILINKNDLSEEELQTLICFIQDIKTEQIETESNISSKTKALITATMITAVSSIVYIAIKLGYPLSQEEIFRLWFVRTVPIMLLLTLQCLTIVWTYVFSSIIKTTRPRSVMKKNFIWAIGIFVVIAMASGIFVHIANDASEHHNSNETVIIKTPVWLDKPSFKLYKEKNFLVLEFLRDADGLEDIDSSITQQEYLNQKSAHLDKESENQEDNKTESNQNNVTIENQQSLEKIKKIDEGYLKIYQTYIKKTDAEYRKAYNAKGYSYIITYDDESQIRFLMYDRDNQEGTKAQYVYYKSNKSSDGSWSRIDAEILGMYQYDYESKDVKDLEQTSW